jgi:hypothetical protein
VSDGPEVLDGAPVPFGERDELAVQHGAGWQDAQWSEEVSEAVVESGSVSAEGRHLSALPDHSKKSESVPFGLHHPSRVARPIG